MRFRSLVILLLFITRAYPQVSNEEVRLDAYTLKEGNRIVWTLFSGFTCQGMVLEWSLDSIHFSPLWEEPGICGDLSAAQTYEFFQYKSNPGIYHYRLQLGNRGYSSILTIHRKVSASGSVVLYPNPVVHESVLTFPNPGKEKYTIVFYQQGREAWREEQQEGNEYRIPRHRFHSGLYHYTITGLSQNVINGKMVVE